MPTILAILLSLFAIVIAVIALIYVVVPLLALIGRFIAHVFRFIGREIGDAMRLLGGALAIVVFVPLVLLSIVVGRWSAASHYGRSLQNELAAMGHAAYRLIVGNPARLVGAGALLEGVERRVPEAMAHAPGRDKPSRRTGQFDGYTIVGSIAGGGSGARLYIAEPDEIKRAVFARAGLDVERVVIKSFSLKEGSSLPQIIREGRALEAAKKIGLVLEHDLTEHRFHYVMPYVPGEPLGTVASRLHEACGAEGLDDRRLREAAGYVGDLLETLDRYHRAGLWHKDVKPDNIIVHDGRAHLVDLGLVTPLRSAMTLTTHGTEYFRDPEMVRMALRGVKVHEVDGVKFDIYAAGAVLYASLENSFPAHGGLSHLTKRCPEALRWIVRRAMTEYQNRYASSGQMLSDLRTVLAAENMRAVKPADLPSMRASDAQPFEEPAAEAPMPPLRQGQESMQPPEFEDVWRRICELQGVPFHTTRGLEFTYSIEGNVLRPSRTEWNIPKESLAHAHAFGSVSGPGDYQGTSIQGPSYVWAILHDKRVDAFSARSVPMHDAPPASARVLSPRRRPNLVVTSWWTGRYKPSASPAPVGAAPAPSPAPSVRRTPRPPREQRPPAQEQLRRAQERARTAQARVARRIESGSRRAQRAGLNAGVVFALLFAGAIVSAFIVKSVEESQRGAASRASVIVDGAEEASAGVVVEGAEGAGARVEVERRAPGVDVRLRAEDVEAIKALLREEFGVDTNAIDARRIQQFARRLERRAESLLATLPVPRPPQPAQAPTPPATQLSERDWVLLNDLGEAAPEGQRQRVLLAAEAMTASGFPVVGLGGDGEEEIERLASLRAAIGTLRPTDARAGEAVLEWLRQRADEVEGVVWFPRATERAGLTPLLFSLDRMAAGAAREAVDGAMR